MQWLRDMFGFGGQEQEEEEYQERPLLAYESFPERYTDTAPEEIPYSVFQPHEIEEHQQEVSTPSLQYDRDRAYSLRQALVLNTLAYYPLTKQRGILVYHYNATNILHYYYVFGYSVTSRLAVTSREVTLFGCENTVGRAGVQTGRGWYLADTSIENALNAVIENA